MSNKFSVIDTVDASFFDIFCFKKAYLQNTISLDKVCHELNITKKDILLYIKYTHGFTSFNCMVQWYRIANAMDIWREEPELPIKQIAKTVGYSSPCVFIFWFLRVKYSH